MKICLQSQNDGWVLDEIAMDFKRYSRHQIVHLNEYPDLIWIINPFIFSSVLQSMSLSCKSVLQIHHINLESLLEYNFRSFNRANFCIVPNKITEEVVSKYLKINTTRLPYWLLSKNIIPRNNEKTSKMKQEICPNGEILIGSFVKDGNGREGNTPKLAKNPNLFLDILKSLKSSLNIKVLLAGYARNYIKSKLEEMKIPYIYLNRYDDVNSLYDCLDWYLVTSKYEGGPQSILEASYRKVKLLSTKVGLAPEVLHNDCICNGADEFVKKILDGVERLDYNHHMIEQNYMPNLVVSKYDDYFEDCVNK